MSSISIEKRSLPSETLYTITNSQGMGITLSTFGAALRSCVLRGRELTLGHPEPADYRKNGEYFAVTVGRFANRIAGGRCAVGKTELSLACNNGANHLHGGLEGFSHRNWEASEVRGTLHTADSGETEAAGIHFTLVSPDGDQGYPGELTVSVSIMLSADNQVVFAYRARTTRSTIVNLTNHAYWNLQGEGSGPVHDHTLRLGAAGWLPVDQGSIPTGDFAPMKGSAWDFSQDRELSTVLSPRTATRHAQWTAGIDHNFVVDPASPSRRCELTIKEGLPLTKISAGTRFTARLAAPDATEMLVYTDLPGVQVYTANYLEGGPGRSGPLNLHGGICLETQLFPDSPNQAAAWRKLGKKLGYKPEAFSHWDAGLEPGQTWQSMTIHRFS